MLKFNFVRTCGCGDCYVCNVYVIKKKFGETYVIYSKFPAIRYYADIKGYVY